MCVSWFLIGLDVLKGHEKMLKRLHAFDWSRSLEKLRMFSIQANFRKIQTGTNVTDIFWESFHKIWKLLNFQDVRPKIPAIPQAKSNGMELPKMWANLARLLSFILRKFHKMLSTRQWKCPQIQTRIFVE